MMEDIRRDPSSEFDSEYIDHLFSAGRTPAKQEFPSAPAPQPEPEPEPVAAEPPKPTEPVAKAFPKPLLVLIAIALLGVGFLLGWLARGDRAVPGETSVTTTQPTYTWIDIDTVPSTNSGIAVDYASMSTHELVQIAMQIQELSSYGVPTSSKTLSVNIYQQLKFSNPVLVELEQRSDAVKQLTTAATTTSDLDASYAAGALIRYYIVYLGFDTGDDLSVTLACQWLHHEDEYTRIFEYTEAPLVTHTFSQSTIFDFQGAIFTLEGDRSEEHEIAPNFWYRIELTLDVPEDESASMPYPALSWHGSSSDTWVTCQRYNKGWFVYGYAAGKTTLSVSIQPYGTPHDIQLTVSPVPENRESPAAFAQCFLDQAATLQTLSHLNADKDLKKYPIVAAVLEKPGCISALLNLAQSTNAWTNGQPSSGIQNNLLIPLLSNSIFTSRMTVTESRALQILRVYHAIYLDSNSLWEPAILETTEGLVLSDMPDCRLGDKPESLKDIPLSEMNYWAYVSLTEGAVILQQPNWDLEITSESTGIVGAWPIYNSSDQLVGWVISGKLIGTCYLRLNLLQGDTAVSSSSLHGYPLST